MKDLPSLKVLDFLRPFFRMFGIDYDVMRKILQVKLTMDGRRVPTIFSGDRSKKRKEGNQFLKSLGIYALYGITLMPFVFLGENYMFQLSIMFGITMFILMTSLISDFSAVLLDVRDKTILNTKPVDSRTINAAKIVHVTIYIIFLAGAFLILPAIAMLIVQDFAFLLLFLIEMFFLILFVMSLTALIYIFILRYFNGEKLKDIINYVQILLSVGIIVGYQIVIRIFDFVSFEFTYDFSWWHVFIPPMWFGAPFEVFLNQNYSSAIILLSILAFVIPIFSIILYYRLMPTFEHNLEKLMEETAKSNKKKWKPGEFMARLLCSSDEEKAFYRFSDIMMSQERDFKLRVYPALGMAFVFPFIFLFNNLNTGSFSELSSGYSYFTIYFSNIIIGIVVYMLKYSEKYKGAWVFQITPNKNPSRFYSATLKAFLVKLYLPIFLALSVIYLAIFSVGILPDLIAVLLTAILHTLISYKVMNNGVYPFSEPLETAKQGGSSMKTFLIMFFVAIFAGVHFMVKLFPMGIYAYLILLFVFTLVGWRIVFPEKEVSFT